MTVAYTKFFMLCKFGEDVGGIYYSFSIIGSHIHFRCPFWTAYSRWRCDRASASSWLQGSSVETSHLSPVQSTLFSWVLKNWIFGPRGNLTKCAAQNENNDGRVSFRNWVQGRCIQNKWIINARVYETHYYRDYQQYTGCPNKNVKFSPQLKRNRLKMFKFSGYDGRDFLYMYLKFNDDRSSSFKSAIILLDVTFTNHFSIIEQCAFWNADEMRLQISLSVVGKSTENVQICKVH